MRIIRGNPASERELKNLRVSQRTVFLSDRNVFPKSVDSLLRESTDFSGSNPILEFIDVTNVSFSKM